MLDDVNYELVMTLEQLAQTRAFPPERFAQRDERLRLFYSLWNGDLTSLVDRREDVAVTVNYFQRFSTEVSEILMTSEPRGGPAELDLIQPLSEALVDMTRYGLTVLEWTPDDNELRTVDPRMYYPLDDGGAIFFRPYVSADASSATEDRAEVTVLDAGGGAEERIYSYASGALGDLVETLPLPATFYVAVGMEPKRPGWGTSSYEIMLPPVLELAKRLSSNSHVLDVNAHPLLMAYMTDAQARDRFPASGPNPSEAAVAGGDYRWLARLAAGRCVAARE